MSNSQLKKTDEQGNILGDVFPITKAENVQINGTNLQQMFDNDSLKGSQGERGIDGKSAYEVAVNNGFVGTEEKWLESLNGSGGNASIPELGNITSPYIKLPVVSNQKLHYLYYIDVVKNTLYLIDSDVLPTIATDRINFKSANLYSIISEDNFKKTTYGSASSYFDETRHRIIRASNEVAAMITDAGKTIENQMDNDTHNIFKLVSCSNEIMSKYTGKPGELVFNLDDATLHLQDNITKGGIPLATKLDIEILESRLKSMENYLKVPTFSYENLCDEKIISAVTIDSKGCVINYPTQSWMTECIVEPGKTYTIKRHSYSNKFTVYGSTKDIAGKKDTGIACEQLINNDNNVNEITFTTNEDITNILIYCNSSIEGPAPLIMLNEGYAAAPYCKKKLV